MLSTFPPIPTASLNANLAVGINALHLPSSYKVQSPSTISLFTQIILTFIFFPVILFIFSYFFFIHLFLFSILPLTKIVFTSLHVSVRSLPTLIRSSSTFILLIVSVIYSVKRMRNCVTKRGIHRRRI